jgi:hypothetical protein
MAPPTTSTAIAPAAGFLVGSIWRATRSDSLILQVLFYREYCGISRTLMASVPRALQLPPTWPFLPGNKIFIMPIVGRPRHKFTARDFAYPIFVLEILRTVLQGLTRTSPAEASQALFTWLYYAQQRELLECSNAHATDR